MNKWLALILFPVPGLVLTVLSLVVGWALFPTIIHSEVEKQVRLVEGSDTWGKWREAPIPIYLSFYVQHVTNPEEVESGLKPVFEEKGPYTYRQKRVKVDIRQEDGKNTVKYREVKTYFFDGDLSGNNTEEDLINIPNIPFVGVIHTIKKMLQLDLIAGLIGNIILNGETLIRRNVSVKEFLFQGFDVSKYTNSLLRRQLPKEFSGGRFGLYKGKNGTASEEWEVFTGVENSLDFGRIKRWNGNEYLNFWQKFSSCDKPAGTDGSVFHPFLTKGSVLDVYSNDVCRSLKLVFTEHVEHLGIPGYRFKAPADSFQDARTSAVNRCFCLEEDLEKCPYAGVLSLESCLKAPIWSSPPHFLDSDVRYLADSGMDAPDREKHETFIDIEPTTGLLLRAHKRLQVSLEVRHNPKVRALQHLTKEMVLFPLLWADESAELDEKLAGEVKAQLLTPQTVVGVAKWVVLILGLVLIIVGIWYAVQKYFLGDPSKREQRRAVLEDLATGSLSGSQRQKRSSGSSRKERLPRAAAVSPATSSENSISFVG